MINTLQAEYPNVPIGYSGHETGLQTTLAAVALGAAFVERHITLDRAMWGSDQAASVEPQGLQPPGPRHPHHRGVPGRRRQEGLRVRARPDEEAAPGRRRRRRQRGRQPRPRAGVGLTGIGVTIPAGPLSGPSAEAARRPARRFRAAPRGAASKRGGTLAFVESPVQLLNVLEWAYADALRASASAPTACDPTGGDLKGSDHTDGDRTACDTAPADPTAAHRVAHGPLAAVPAAMAQLTVVVLSPHDPMTRGQLRRMAELARDEGHRGALGGGPRRRRCAAADRRRTARPAARGRPGSSSATRSPATCSCCSPSPAARRPDRRRRRHGHHGVHLPAGPAASGWCAGTGAAAAAAPRDLVFAPVSATARRRLTPSGDAPGRGVQLDAGRDRRPAVDASPPTTSPGPGPASARPASPGAPTWSAPRWWRPASSTRTATWRRSPHWPVPTARPATSRTAGRAPRSSTGWQPSTGLEIVRPDLPLELIARRGPIGRTILSFPSTVVHTLPLALAGHRVRSPSATSIRPG